jgi:hypothetical protein
MSIIFLSKCDVKIFLTFTSPNMVLLWQLFYLFCSCINIFTSHFDKKIIDIFNFFIFIHFQNASLIIFSAETEYISTRYWYRNINLLRDRIVIFTDCALWSWRIHVPLAWQMEHNLHAKKCFKIPKGLSGAKGVIRSWNWRRTDKNNLEEDHIVWRGRPSLSVGDFMLSKYLFSPPPPVLYCYLYMRIVSLLDIPSDVCTWISVC